jgi:gamma-glutamylcyclotransferase (GGCT)/AIG2-like uncharacterized protein YtfP
MPRSLLFVYGTLHPDRAPLELAADVARFLPLGEGTIEGELHEAGGYPAVLVDDQYRGSVAGVVFELPDDAALLKRLDDYEGFYPANPEASLYVRRLLPVTSADGQRRDCWVYVYNQPIQD